MGSKPGMTIDQHRHLGAELMRIRLELMDLLTDAGNLYPKASKPHKQVHKTLRSLDKLRCVLDAQCAVDCPVDFSTKIYYGGQPKAMWTCNNCGRKSVAEEERCWFCGDWKCHKCGYSGGDSDLDADAKYKCPKCGHVMISIDRQ